MKLKPLDAFRQRVYIAPRGLWLTLDSGTFDSLEVNTRTHAVRVGLARASVSVPRARLRVEQPAKMPGIGTYRPAKNIATERGALVIPLQSGTSWVELADN